MTTTAPSFDAPARRSRPSPNAWRLEPGPRPLLVLPTVAVPFALAAQHPVGLVTAGFLLAAIAAARVGGWATSPGAVVCLLAAVVPAGFVVVRTSPWLVPLNVLAVLGLVSLAAMLRDEPNPVGAALGRLIRPRPLLEPAVMSAEFVGRAVSATLPRDGGAFRRMALLVRGIALAAPVVVILLALLASADALFRDLVTVSIDPGLISRNALLVSGGTVGASALLGHAAWGRIESPRPPRVRLGATEIATTLGGILAVYAAFTATQVVSMVAGNGYVLRTTGLTYAEYARQGFFQLLAAAVLTLAVLRLLERHRGELTERGRRLILGLELGTIALTIVVVAVAVRRLFLYEEAFGLTMMRLFTIVFAVWIGVVFIAVAAHRMGRLRIELPAAVLTSALVTLLAVNIVNPEALVAQRNLDRFGGTDQLDLEYLTRNLGDDALPTLVTDPTLAEHICGELDRPDDRIAVFHRSRARAAAAYDDACG